MKPIVLASQSPRRKELLEKCGLPFTIDVADIDESINLNNDLKKEIEELAFKKANTVLKRHPEAIVIGSDTIVTINQEVLGKPKDDEDAKRMLKKLSGTSHKVITGLCILSNLKKYSTASVSEVTFVDMSDEEILKYIETGETKDKAGAYAIQGYGSRYISSIKGDYYTIMGLPVFLV